MNDTKKQTGSVIFKIIMFILVFGYATFYIYQLYTDKIIINNDENIKIILLFISFFLMGCSLISKNKLSLFFSITNILLICCIILFNYIKLPKINNSSKKIETGKITCTGKTDNSDNTTINLDYEKNKINKIEYIYIYSMEEKNGAENLVNHFDKQYSEINSIYSEITYTDKIEVKFTYNLNKLDKETIKSLDNISDSYKEFKDKNLNNLECKNRD